MLQALEVKPSGLPHQDPYTQLFLPLIVVLLCNCFRIQLLGQVMFCVVVTSMTHIPNQHHFTQKSAHEVPNAFSEARVRPIFI